MPWSKTWSGTGPVSAKSVAVIGTTTELDADISTFGASLLFKDRSGNNAARAVIYSARAASTNSMDVDFFTADPPLNNIGQIRVEPGYIQFEADSVGATVTASLTLQSGRLDVVGELWANGETWHSLILGNGWSQIAGYLPISYRKTPYNQVEFRGTIHNGTNADNTQIATLPVGYRPVANALLRPPVGPSGSGNAGSSRIFINTAGGVFIYGMTGVTDIGFDGKKFSLDT